MKANLRLSRLTIVRLLSLCAVSSFGGQPPATGLQHLTFTERSPLSAPEVVLKRLGRSDQPNAEALAGHYILAEESFTAFVPPDYSPKAPPGLLVWTGVSQFSPGWTDVLRRRRLILIFADRGVGHPTPYGLLLDAVYNLERIYAIDTNRVYISGFSAGGALAK